ncbi:MAG: hypothetical protein KAX44_06520 [Candidatus Brocadiae bacterium]|nr:hypothetical protein [Candidatus Brocadiia bacterium]
MIEIAYRELYAPAHFGNSYEVMYPGEMRELLAEAKFWGFNAYGDWFDAADLRNPANNPRNEYLQPQAFRDRKVSHFRTAGELGFDLGLVLTPNHVYLDQLREDLRAETTDERYFGQLLCPSKPEARGIILENHRYLFETLRDAGVAIGSLAACPYDYGGCGCEACRPWIVTFGKLCLEIAELAEEYFPGVAARLVGWWWTDEDHAAFTAWADGEAPGRFASIARYIKYGQCAPNTSQPIPRGCASFAFVHIGYADAATPRDVYGPWGPTIAPNRLAKTASSLCEGGVQGYMAYSEGAFDDVNKALLAGLTSGRFGQPREVLEAYAERYLGAHGTGRTAWAEWMMQWGEPFQTNTAEARRQFDRLVKGARRTWRLEQLESKLRLFEAHNEVKHRSAWDAERLAAASRFFAEQERLQRGIWGLGLVRHVLNERFHRPDWYAEWAALQSKGQADTATAVSEA